MIPALAIAPERPQERPDPLEEWLRRATGRMMGPMRRASLRRRRLPLLAEVAKHRPAMRDATMPLLVDDARAAAAALRSEGWDAVQPVGHGLAALAEVARRTVGLDPHDVQLLGADILLQGVLAEMATGEGKTLVAALAGSLAALAGTPVHVITPNDYLAGRDAAAMQAFYSALGLSVGTVTSSAAPAERRAAYRTDICYCTNKELAFDYLRDRDPGHSPAADLQRRLAHLRGNRPAPLIPGLHFAIVDEADSILVDEARTPMILSEGQESQVPAEDLIRVMDVVRAFEANRDHSVDRLEWRVRLTLAGRARLDGALAGVQGPLALPLVRHELALQALMALSLYRRDEHYVVSDGAVQIVDEYTGRIMPDRVWRAGLHQMIEVKEGCAVTDPRVTRAEMTFQRLFRRYMRLSGMSGTLSEVQGELRAVYGLEVLSIPTNRPVQRSHWSDRVFRSTTAKWQAVAAHTARLHATGAPVLLGTRTIAGAVEASQALDAAGLPHRVLSARDDADEAQVIADAGQASQITVATNMAGRGTDIRLGPGVAAAGGLHVILCERHDSRRIDRQLFGRAARQGDPGSCIAMLSLTDPLARLAAPGWCRRIAGGLMALGPGASPVGEWLARGMIRAGQKRRERAHSRIRKRLLKADRTRADLLAFAGSGE